MKKEIHPNYNTEAMIKCACGNIIKTGSTKKEMEMEICSDCHPFFTGKEKLIDSTGRVEKFRARLESSKAKQEKIKKTASKATASKAKKEATKEKKEAAK